MPSRITRPDDDRLSNAVKLAMNSMLRKSALRLDDWLSSQAGLNIKNPELDKHLQQLSQSADDGTIDNASIDDVIQLFQQTIKRLEQFIWKNSPCAESITLYQDTFKNLEALYNLKTQDERYDFKIVIPVADRPQHLRQCLQSLLTLCHSYHYGGIKNDRFSKISVLIADDSRDESNILLHESYCTEFSDAGLSTEYFGLRQQLALVKTISPKHSGLTRILSDTDHIDDVSRFSHKGASIMRNITYLKLNRELSQSNTLIYFIDSDQEFCINDSQSDNKYYAINYFHYLNENFKTSDISVLTGKVVGDPPVSPAVMAGNFQQDIKNFLDTIAKLKPEDACQFHRHEADHLDDAAYHDMASLFGFSDQEQVFNYHCSFPGAHTNADCFGDFSNKLDHFFYGEHPTRKTVFNYEQGFSKTVAARTVYTGNYVIKPEALSYFIPFATLKLRMAGPVLGRILKTRLQHGFVSANLPMLHNRTVDATGQSEFRPGVKNKDNNIDFGNEFVRQFYGDVMLFSMEKITAAGFPDVSLSSDMIQATLNTTYDEIKAMYVAKHHTILRLKKQITEQLGNPERWWHDASDNAERRSVALGNFDEFLNNIQANFDDHTASYLQCTLPDNAQKHLDSLLQAILEYPNDLSCWQLALKQQH
jgi:hypothetical protein